MTSGIGSSVSRSEPATAEDIKQLLDSPLAQELVRAHHADRERQREELAEAIHDARAADKAAIAPAQQEIGRLRVAADEARRASATADAAQRAAETRIRVEADNREREITKLEHQFDALVDPRLPAALVALDEDLAKTRNSGVAVEYDATTNPLLGGGASGAVTRTPTRTQMPAAQRRMAAIAAAKARVHELARLPVPPADLSAQLSRLLHELPPLGAMEDPTADPRWGKER